MTFRPQLFPNEAVTIDDMPDQEYMVSVKLDGIRCVYKDGEMLSRSLKSIPNERLHEKFKYLKEWSREHKTLLDGELYSHTMTFQEITSVVMSNDKDVPDSLQFWCFDAITRFNGDFLYDEPFIHRYSRIPSFIYLNKVPQYLLRKENIQARMDNALQEGYEGLIIRHPRSVYKCGRISVRSGNGYKLKPYRTFDATIAGFIQATEVRPDAQKRINELGFSQTSKKKDDRIPVDRVAAFIVDYEGKELKVVYAATDTEREQAYKQQDSLMGKMIEYKGMLVGAKDLPRHPVFLRFREDRDDDHEERR